MKWKDKLINYLIEELKYDKKWENTVEQLAIDSSVGIHLAIFNEPFLSLIFKGEKKIESRFSLNKISPFEKVREGDIIILKESGGLVTGAFIAGNVKYFRTLDKTIINKIETEYGKDICTTYDKDFWEKRSNAKYASLIEVKKVKHLKPIKSGKKDRSGWSVLREGISNNLFKELK